MLPVAVEPHGDVVVALERVPEARLDGRADAEVEREPDDGRARAAAAAAVASDEPSSTTTTSMAGSNAWISATTAPIAASSSNAGTTATIRSASCVHRRLEPEQPQHLPRPVCVRVLVEDALARAAPIASASAGIVEQRPVRL